ncbi:hypothetical protein GLYMA_06G236300v4 [Glycine max]|uniref:Uncharacterized protein n=1 Tax=Glycine max TaxID=3847 RepID=A0A0R0JL23_SOYBN|nr:hypothetical protein GYH30_016056 [Glycine max]KRH55194.1 hypothetical protein GLYMA_06G236300v4 [Glycine max]
MLEKTFWFSIGMKLLLDFRVEGVIALICPFFRVTYSSKVWNVCLQPICSTSCVGLSILLVSEELPN